MNYDDLPRLLTRMTGDEKHSAGAASTLDVIWVLYDRVMHIDPKRLDAADRDRFLLSKGHGPMAYYAVLAAKGFFPLDWLDDFASYESALGQHPDRTLVPGVEIASGSLGHGLPMAVGVALALRARRVQAAGRPGGEAVSRGNRIPRVFCLVGDAELDEGSNHEAIVLAGRRALSELTVIVIDNRSASLGWPGGIAARFELEGFWGAEIDGRDHDAIAAALGPMRDRPAVVVARVESW